MNLEQKKNLLVGWASADITPSRRVYISGQFHARISEGIMDPITATALVITSGPDNSEQVVMVSCDVVGIPDELRDGVRDALRSRLPELDVMKVFLNATHTHTAPVIRESGGVTGDDFRLADDVMTAKEYRRLMLERIVEIVERAWKGKRPGGIAWGLGNAVVGHCRRCCYKGGRAEMYGDTNDPTFRHMEGYEDPGVNLLFTYNAEKKLTGMIVNIACTSQVSEMEFKVSADFWHDTRNEIRKRHGEDIFILPQAGPAGDQSPHRIWRRAAEDRMLKLAGRDRRAEIAYRITNAVDHVLALVEPTIEFEVTFTHLVKTIALSRRMITKRDVENAEAEAANYRRKYEEEVKKIDADPSSKEQPRWYVKLTDAQRGMNWNEGVAERFELQKTEPTIPMELHVIRLGDVAFASNRFELYLDYGMRIKAQSRAGLNFLIQLAGPGTYLPTQRSVAGGGYGSVAASTLVGPEGGQELVDATVEQINALWPEGD